MEVAKMQLVCVKDGLSLLHHLQFIDCANSAVQKYSQLHDSAVAQVMKMLLLSL